MSRKLVLPNNFFTCKKNNLITYPKPRLTNNSSGHQYVSIPGAIISKNLERSIDPNVLEHIFSSNNKLFKPNMRVKVTNAKMHLMNPYRNKTKNNKYIKFLRNHKDIKPYENTRRNQNKKIKRRNPYKRTNSTKRQRQRQVKSKKKRRKNKSNNIYRAIA